MESSSSAFGVPPLPRGDGAPYSAGDAHAAAIEVGARARRLRAVVIAAFVLAGMSVGAVGYVCLRAYFLGRSGMSSPIAVASLTFLPALAASLALTRPLARWFVAQRKPSWIASAARHHRVEPAEVAELASLAGR